MSENASSTLNDKECNNEELQFAVNSIQNTAFIERLPNPKSLYRGIGDILWYDLDNLYPNKVKSMAERSQSTLTAIETLSIFTRGNGFENEADNDIIINSLNETLKDMLTHSVDEKSMFKGFALHFNYNIFGEIIEIQELPFETLRYSKDLTELVFCEDWSRVNQYSKEHKEIYKVFNPDTVVNEINEVGIDKYNGQVFYWKPKNKQVYPLCRYDRCLDDTQFEHESGLFKLRNIQNDYSAGHIIFYPAQIKTALEQQGLINDVKRSRGSANAGVTKAVPVNITALEALGGRKMIEEIPRTGIDKMFAKQNEETRNNIYAAFQQPKILNGIADNGMFNQESFVDAFDYYNSRTESDRQEVEAAFNKFMPYTIWGLNGLKIKPLEFMSKRDKENNNETNGNGKENNTEE